LSVQALDPAMAHRYRGGMEHKSASFYQLISLSVTVRPWSALMGE